MAANKIWAALAAAQADFGTVSKTGKNPHFKSTYATLQDVISVTQDALHKHGLVVYQAPVIGDNGLYLRSVLAHTESGETIEDMLPLLTAKNDMQALGSAISYARRYLLMAQLGIAAEDDDGNDAVAQPKQQAQRKPAPAPQQHSNGHAPEPPAGNPFDDAEPPAEAEQEPGIDAGTLKRLNILGRDVYADEWDAKRPVLVSAISMERTKSSKELTEAEAKRLIAGMQAKQAQDAQPDAKAKAKAA